ncbi:hypothetical protein B0H63DRAFT_465791 [Podospora didyma]|uniref:Uncharacterized protein n=1 Tax=Podospora didyma TaxID=330526 RepID=A0AAE0NZG2_9PEZI|nr:hypothetical protein B0H63DRAFT_465791 [Podospora didyma]
MAQGAQGGAAVMAARASSGNNSLLSTLVPGQISEARQYEKLMRFHDEVVGGLHPRIKPAHLPGKPAQGGGGGGQPPVFNVPIPTAPAAMQRAAKGVPVNGDRRAHNNFQSFQANLQRPPVNTAPSLPGLGGPSSPASGPSRPFGFGKPEINPVLLEKSDDLIKAELQLHRQRLERGLKEQMEQRRASHKASLQASEQLAEFDIADVLARALVLVQAASAPSTDDTAAQASANDSASGDSFDDNTFYSSQVDTPQSHQISRVPIQNESDDEQMRDGSPYEPELDPEPTIGNSQVQPATGPSQNLFGPSLIQHQPIPTTSIPAVALPQARNAELPGLSREASGANQGLRPPLANETSGSRGSVVGSGMESRSEESGNTGREQADRRDLARVNERLLNQALSRVDSPVVRAHDLSPVAPQPAHVSPLATARQSRLVSTDTVVHRATPAQVAALRMQPSAVSSPDSSPQGSRGAEKKKGKKKKRKAAQLAAEAAAVASAASPYIKPEPRSASPMIAPSYDRPNKRQRQSQNQNTQFNGEQRYGQPTESEDGYQERYPPPNTHREERVVDYVREDEMRPRNDTQPLLIASQRYERVYYDGTRPAPPPAPGSPGAYSTRYVNREVRNDDGRQAPSSPRVYPTQYVSREVRTVRPVSHAVESSFGDSTTYYGDARTASRMSTRPPVYRERSQSLGAHERPSPAMPPPQAAPTRIIVDAFGREYLEPPRSATTLRDGLAPESRGADPERIYERVPPPRSISRRPDIFEDDGVKYRPASPAYAAHRRVVTQPEFAVSDRIYRERGQPDHSMAPPATPASEFLPPGTRILESRHTGESQGGYIVRSASTRPTEPPRGYTTRPVEPVRYDGAAGYDTRTAEEPPRDYYAVRAGSVRPTDGVRYEIPVAYERRIGDEREYTAIRSASVRPAEPIRYEIARDYGSRLSSTRPSELPVHDYTASGHRDQRDMQPLAPISASRAYSVLPPDAPQGQAVRRDYSVQPLGEQQRFYGRPPPLLNDEVIFLDRPPRELYR